MQKIVALVSHQCRIDVASMSHRCRIDVASMSRRCRVDVASMSRRCRLGVASVSHVPIEMFSRGAIEFPFTTDKEIEPLVFY